MDALINLLGIIAGIVVFGELFPWAEGFYYATPMGQVTLPQLLNLPYGLVVFLVALMAIGGFAGATWVEKFMASRKGKPV
jgi:hypothetical protein